MEKLIELLNEYNFQEYNVKRFFKEENVNNVMKTEWIISKRYGFIKWLVDNDKIDVESYCRITSVERKWEKDVYRDEVDSLIMLLAISDNPIDFLIEILK